MRVIKRYFFVLSFLLIAPVQAAETTTYEYDAQGRLIKSIKSGGPQSGAQKTTSFDPAGNRTNQTVTGASSGTPTCFLQIWDSGMTVGGPHYFYITRTGTCPEEFDVFWATSNGTAISGTHYYGYNNVRKEINGSTESIAVQTISGSVEDDDMKWFTITLTENEPSVELLRATATGRIEGPDY